MEHAFPYRFEPQESGGVLVQFVDVPEAHTFGATDADAGGDHALDCLIAALGGYIKLGREVPRPSPARGRPVAILPPLVAAKLALYESMRAQHITRTTLARRLGLQENAVRRLLDLDHRSHIDQVARALAALGKRLEVLLGRRVAIGSSAGSVRRDDAAVTHIWRISVPDVAHWWRIGGAFLAHRWRLGAACRRCLPPAVNGRGRRAAGGPRC